MFSLASKLLNLAVSSQDCTRNDLRRSKIQNFPGGGPPDPFSDALHALATLLIASYGPELHHKRMLETCSEFRGHF